MEAISERYEAALVLAARAHRNQLRKAGQDPYIVHPVAVSILLLGYGFSEEVAIAGLLHDVVEDSEVGLDQIEDGFGPVVAEMVAALTERKREGDVERAWEVRKQEALDSLCRASLGAVAVKAADALHNASAIVQVLYREGPAVWHKFSRGPQQTLRYYRDVAAIVHERLGEHPLVGNLDATIVRLEQAITETGEP